MGVTKDRFKKAFGGGVGDALLAERQAKVREALKELKIAVDALEAIGSDPGDHKRALLGYAVRFNNISKQPGGNKGIYDDLEALKNEARNAAAAAQRAARQDPKAAAGINKALVNLRCGGNAKEVRRDLDRLLATDAQALAKLAALPGGAQALDEVMKNLGTKASSTADKNFAKAAIVARYGMGQLEGDLDAKNLPALYRVLGMVPESHAKNNPKMLNIKLTKGGGGGDYTGGQLNLECGRPSHLDRDEQFRGDDEDGVDPAWKAQGDEHSTFDATTLHEVGHAVDDQMSFMGSRRGQAAFGAWEQTDADTLADKAGNHFGFFGKFSESYSQDMLQRMVRNQLTTSAEIDRNDWTQEKRKADAAPTRELLLADAGLQQIEVERARLLQEGWQQQDVDSTFNGLKPSMKGFQYFTAYEAFNRMRYQKLPLAQAVDAALRRMAEVGDPPDDDEWGRMLKHPCLLWCRTAAAGEAWKLGAAHAKKVAKMDGRVYTKDKSGWYSYDPAVRAKSISKYQFNTPAEWFAELYSAYYLKKLPEAHPDYKWLHERVHAYAP